MYKIPVDEEALEIDEEEHLRQEVESIATNSYFAGENEDMRNNVRIIVAAIHLGTNADKLASFLGLNRDHFVRPRVRRLRENGIFVQGTLKQRGHVVMDVSEDAFRGRKGMQRVFLWFTMAALVAEGIAVRTTRGFA